MKVFSWCLRSLTATALLRFPHICPFHLSSRDRNQACFFASPIQSRVIFFESGVFARMCACVADIATAITCAPSPTNRSRSRTYNGAKFRIQLHRFLFQRFLASFEFVGILPRRRRALVITFDMLAVMSRAEAAWVAVEPNTVSVARDVKPCVFHGGSLRLCHIDSHHHCLPSRTGQPSPL